MKTYHLEGMGVLGCLMALQLLEQDIPFTWWDNNSEVNAWRASGGSIFRSKSEMDDVCYHEWLGWARCDAIIRENLQKAPTWYSTKAPPHGAKFKPVAEVGVLKRGPDEYAGMYLDVPEFVRQVRNLLITLRSEQSAARAQRIVAHGFSKRLKMYLWGWTATARLRVHPDIIAQSLPYRPSFYLRRGLYTMAYAAPYGALPDVWLVGSSMIAQLRPKELDVLPKLDRWGATVRDLSNGDIEFEKGMELRNGWRPVGTIKDDVSVIAEGGIIYLPSLGHSGVRHAPAVWRNLQEHL